MRPQVTPARAALAQKVGDYYASFMDEDQHRSQGADALADEMAVISAITNKASLSAYLGTTLNGEVDGLTANCRPHFRHCGSTRASKTRDHNVVHFWQGGLGMPDRDNYLDPSPKMADLRAQYQAHIAAILKLAGVADSEAKGRACFVA